VAINVWHVMGDEKYECVIEKLFMRNCCIKVCIWYWVCECVLVRYIWNNVVISISKFYSGGSR
jgi:hypothetical protein